jgi:uncharacterized protein YigA (DUF484 family)
MELDDHAVVDYLLRNPEFLSVMHTLLKLFVFLIPYAVRFR